MDKNIKTIEELVAAVNSKNIANFLKDFESWLTMSVMLREQNIPGVEHDTSVFKWIDDGKNDIKITIKLE